MNWRELCIGYGIQKVPRKLLAADAECQLCHEKRHLYTTSRLEPTGDGMAAWGRMLDILRVTSYCKAHITWLYTDKDA